MSTPAMKSGNRGPNRKKPNRYNPNFPNWREVHVGDWLRLSTIAVFKKKAA